MTFDNEGQREIILQALMNVPIQATYPGLAEVFPKMQATVEAVKAATVVEPQAVEAAIGTRGPGPVPCA